jgi:hypothetical protein
MNDPAATRREFIQGTLRWVSAGAVAGVTGLALVRNAGAECRRPSVCGACPVYSGCDLPKAESFRRDEAGDNEHGIDPGPAGQGEREPRERSDR